MNDTALLRYFQVEHYLDRQRTRRHLTVVDSSGDDHQPPPEPPRHTTPNAA